MKTEREVRAIADTVSVWEFQWNPAELVSLAAYVGSPRRYLEIGAGSGLVCHTFNAILGFKQIHVIDDNGYDFSGPGRAKRIPQAVEWVGDSTLPECRDAVAGWGVKFDFVLIDGCHNGDAPRSDTFLVLPWLADGAFVAFHDKGWGRGQGGIEHGVKEWLAELAAGVIPGLTETPWRSDNTALYQYKAKA